jgi:4-methyl-5(b-hydroxyethyl)-thiazole monophosphate biosynthesis
MKAYVFLADGFETIEALTPVAVLRRAGVEVKTVSVTGSHKVVSSHKVEIKADIIHEESDLADGDMLILPGGFPGYVRLGKSLMVAKTLSQYNDKGKFIAAICGAPTVLAKHGIAKGKKITCHGSVKKEMGDYKYTDENVVIDGNLISCRGAGYSLEFGLALAGVLVDSDTIQKVREGMELA